MNVLPGLYIILLSVLLLQSSSDYIDKLYFCKEEIPYLQLPALLQMCVSCTIETIDCGSSVSPDSSAGVRVWVCASPQSHRVSYASQ